MKLFLYSINYSPELTGIGKYNGELTATLSNMDVDVSVITAPPYYPEWGKRSGYSYSNFSTEIVDGVTVYRCPLYVPKTVTTLKRILHLLSFAVSSAIRLGFLIKKRPYVVFLIQPTFFCVPFTLLYCKITGAKSIMHIQDFELDAMLGLGMAKGSKIKWFLSKVETWFLKKFDCVSTISHSMLSIAQNKGVDKDRLIFLPNWADINFVTPQTCGKSLKKKLGLEKFDKIILYSGNIGKKQGLEIVIEAAKSFTSRPDVLFLFVGTGAHVDVLKGAAQKNRLNNVRFLPLQDWCNVPSLLSMADLHLVIQRKGAADAVLPSKLTNILSAGGMAIVTADIDTELGQLARQYPGIYKLIEPENSAALVQAIFDSLHIKSEHGYNKIAREYAESHLDREVIVKRFMQELRKTIH
ncbi:colanic acid biosynthesis glycosyl transferase WcaI [Marisediminitalea aggregata]|uniref:Colanic acid biosynthesis glycosyl transferase WcaI n=1 Tax=Marisediminitalea aggregata TaxID=634436 RepID=A0A1M5HFQ1_9ALTE|nr:WcaI family glycosyltransferase [Marisediminitalea aggregata]SHG14784.1 colanic acid biosynthesis glycosyl transferase WcaI [Marisediminitalea aggregata]